MPLKSVCVGLSGGKDSAASVLLLKKDYEVSGIYMKIGMPQEDETESRVRELARTLKISLHVVDYTEAFNKSVRDYFFESYKNGLTPNPCTRCNRDIKFSLLYDYCINTVKTDFYATGHYADKVRINGKWFLKEPADRRKSQIYFLSTIKEGVLERTLFPLKNIKISDIREMTSSLPLAGNKDSQDICFMKGLKLNEFLKTELPELFKKGDFLDIKGNKIGEHNGALIFTRGQRKGTGFSSDRKLYVVKTDVLNNTVTLGENMDLFNQRAVIKNLRIWEKPDTDYYTVKVRYMGEPANARIVNFTEHSIELEFSERLRAVTPGQLCVLYRDSRVIAAGDIV